MNSKHFICKYCQTLIDIAVSEEPADINAIDELINAQICEDCYDKLTNDNIKLEDNIVNEINKIKKKEASFIKTTTSSEYQSSLTTDEDQFITTINAKQEELNSLIKEEKELENELTLLLKEFDNLTNEEETLINNFNQQEQSTYSLSKKLNIKKTQYKQLTLENMHYISVAPNMLNELFTIQIKQNYGVINSHRMLYSTQNFSFDEISGGWGDIVFLTAVLIEKFDAIATNPIPCLFEFYPCKSFSYFRNKKTNNTFYLYKTDPKDELTKSVEELNKAMIEFIKVLKHLMIVVTSVKPDQLMFFEIYDKGINNCPISINLSTLDSEREWSECMKHVLLILKMCLTALATCQSDKIEKMVGDIQK